MNKKNIFILICLLIFMNFHLWPANWYVDNAASGGNTGFSWENAWKSFSNIKWGTGGVGPGDTLYISGGENSKVYLESLEILTSGELNNPITVRVGQEENHHGRAIITSSSTTGGIFIYDARYITIDGEYNNKPQIVLMDCGGQGIYAYMSDHIILKHVEVDHNGYGGNDGDGIRIYFEGYDVKPICEISNSLVHDNYQDQIFSVNGNPPIYDFGYISVHHCEIYNVNDDGYESGHGGIDFYNNIVHDRIGDGGAGHPDGVYFAQGYCRIYNNIFYNFSNNHLLSNSFIGMSLRTQQIDGVWQEFDASHIYIHNNLIYENVENATNNYVRGIEVGGAPNNIGINKLSNVVVSNNTIVATPAWALLLGLSELSASSTENNITVVNNVFYNIFTLGGGQVYLFGHDGTGTPVYTYGSYGDNADLTIDYNCIHPGPEGSEIVSFQNVMYDNITELNTVTGCEAHSTRENPMLNNITFMPASEDSPIVNTGLDLSFIFDGNPELEFMRYDIDGNLRPTGLWDMGAYEFNDGTATLQDFLPRHIRIK